ncbi:hypothetical protein C9374_007527 [Naegleria lovaniensis]|uniref:Aquaporin n=1 Tax=Naegleria lovaniensis TaxID=51637 RepID=A0AA88GN78_NAELO|nr:uncharacterized protein C9374_007527 [Naegleria lovaniensis]KAG2379388.1 hypothetical protein C9374_007527 [Naegleria lovaniensis]
MSRRFDEEVHEEKFDRPGSKKKTSSNINLDDMERGQRKEIVADEIELEDNKVQDVDPVADSVAKNILPYFTHPDIIFDWRAVLGEFLGTMLFILIGTLSSQWSNGDYIRGSLGHIFGLIIVIHVFAPISGAHVNPAVTIAVLVTRNIGIMSGVLYLCAQCLGATVASSLTLWIAGGIDGAVFILPADDVVTALRGFTSELLMTFMFVTTIFGAAVKVKHLNTQSYSSAPHTASKMVENESKIFLEVNFEPIAKIVAALYIGLALGANAMAGALTGACMNPARALGPMLISWSFYKHCWIYYTAPFLGAILAALMFEFVLTPNKACGRLCNLCPKTHQVMKLGQMWK